GCSGPRSARATGTGAAWARCFIISIAAASARCGAAAVGGGEEDAFGARDPCSLRGAFARRRRIGVAAAVKILDLVARRAVGAADAGKIARPDRRFAVAAGDVEHVSGLA